MSKKIHIVVLIALLLRSLMLLALCSLILVFAVNAGRELLCDLLIGVKAAFGGRVVHRVSPRDHGAFADYDATTRLLEQC